MNFGKRLLLFLGGLVMVMVGFGFFAALYFGDIRWFKVVTFFDSEFLALYVPVFLQYGIGFVAFIASFLCGIFGMIGMGIAIFTSKSRTLVSIRF